MSLDAQMVARYFHPARWPAFRRAGMSDADLAQATARLARTDEGSLRTYNEEFERQNRVRVEDLLHDPEVAGWVNDLPFSQGDRILALGDSMTDDALSWAELLRILIESRFGPGNATVDNHGITGDKTSDVISRLDTLGAGGPTWVIQLLGANDARRHGGAIDVQTTTLAETTRNLAEIRRYVEAELRARYVVMTPPPVIDAQTESWAPFQLEAIRWRDADVLAIGQAILDADPTAIDLHQAFLDAPTTGLLLPDGVHPTPLGQELIVRRVLQALAG